MAIAGSQWRQFKAKVMEMIHKTGRAYLHVGPHGASVTPSRIAPGRGRLAVTHRADATPSHTSLPTFARMGAMAQSANTTNNSHAITNNSNSNSAHINAVNINVPHADPNTIATGLDSAIRRQMSSGMANYGAR